MNNKTNEIVIKTRKRLFGANIGRNISAFKGDGLDFREIREYNPGDDVKKINWKVTAKNAGNKLYVNEFNEERELNIVLLFMVSGNIYFGSHRSKQEAMSEALSLLTQAALMEDNRVTTIFYSDKIEQFFKPTKKLDSVYLTVDYALNLNPIGKVANYESAFDYINSTIKQKSIIFIIGDFYEDIDISQLLKHEVYSVIVRDKFEENPSFNSEITLQDLVSKEVVKISDTNSAINSYKNAIKAQDDRLFEHLDNFNTRFTKLYTNEDAYFKLLNLCAV